MLPWFKKILLASLAILAPIHAIMTVTGILIFADFITGMWAAKKRGEEIHSAGMRRTVSKLLIYQIVVITGFVSETYMLGGALPLSKIAAGLIATVELKSILENANVILGYDLFKDLLAKLGSKNDK